MVRRSRSVESLLLRPNRPVSRRQLLRTTVAAGAALPAAQLLAACGGDDESASGDAAGQITFMKGPASDQDTQYQKLYAQQFTSTNQDISVTPRFYDWETIDADLTAAFSSEPPDVSYLVTRVWPTYAEAGSLADLSDRIEESSFQETREAIPESLWESITGPNGEVWGVPWLGAVFPVFVNEDLVASAGVTDWESSWDAMFEAAGAIQDGNVFGVTVDQTIQDEAFHHLGAYIHNGGGELVVDGEAGLDVPGVVEAFDLWARIHADGLTPRPGLYDAEGKQALFRAGRVGLAHGNPSLIVAIDEANVDFAWDVALAPEGPAGRTAYGDFGYLSIAAESENQDAAWEYVKFLSAPQQASDYVIKLGRQLQAVRDDVADEIFPGGDSPAKRLQTDFVPQVKPYTAIPNQLQALRGLITEFELAIRGDKAPADAVSAANEAVNQVLA